MLFRLTDSYSEPDIPRLKELWIFCVVIFILYFYLFQPPIINKVYYPAFESIVFVIVLFIKRKLLFGVLRSFKNEIYIFIIIILFTLFRDIAAGGEVYFTRFAALCMSAFFCGSVVLLYCNNKQISLFNLLYWTSLIAASLSLLLFFVHSFDNWYKSVAYYDPYYSMMQHYVHRYRAYGIAENLLFTYPYVLGIFASYSLLLIKKNHIYIIHFLIFILVIFLNARIGLFPIILVFLYLTFIIKDYRLISKILVSLFFTILVVWLLIAAFGINMISLYGTLEWVGTALTSLIGGDIGVNHVNLYSVYRDMIVIPNNIILGDGVNIFTNNIHNSDIGFILQLNYGGIIFLSMMVFFSLSMIYRLIQTLGLKNWFVILFSMSLVILNIKGFVFAATPGARLLLLLYMCFIFKKRVQYNKNFELSVRIKNE